jgi:predicted HAD superfamily Cof-like phosphohydrolase
MHEKFKVHEAIEKMDKTTLKAFLRFRVACIQEEVDELKSATADNLPIDGEETVDALIDICVFAIGTMDLFGIDADDAWDEVLRANINKEVGVKPGRPNPFGLPDLIKPEGWKAPSHKDNHGKLKDL